MFFEASFSKWLKKLKRSYTRECFVSQHFMFNTTQRGLLKEKVTLEEQDWEVHEANHDRMHRENYTALEKEEEEKKKAERKRDSRVSLPTNLKIEYREEKF